MSSLRVTCRARPILDRLWVWALLSLALSLAWEIAQLPLYTIWTTESATSIAYAVAHCTAGDVLIACGGFILAAFFLGDAEWPVSRPRRGATVAILYGLTYSIYSEWHNVYVLRSWSYASNMPAIFGIGVSPLLQWVVVPLATVLIVRAWSRRG
jgi:hypothetical protein